MIVEDERGPDLGHFMLPFYLCLSSMMGCRLLLFSIVYVGIKFMLNVCWFLPPSDLNDEHCYTPKLLTWNQVVVLGGRVRR